jgi:hypothetical protein
VSVQLPPAIASRQDVARLRTEVERYQAWVRQYQNAAKRDIQYQHEQPALSDAATVLIRQWLESKQSLDQLIAELAATANTAPSITLTLVAPAPSSVQSALVSWVRTNLNQAMLVEFRWNASILGGIIARTDTTLYDWSYRAKLLGSRDRLIERLLHV